MDEAVLLGGIMEAAALEVTEAEADDGGLTELLEFGGGVEVE